MERFLVRIEAIDELILLELPDQEKVDEEVLSIAVYRQEVLEAIEVLSKATASTGTVPKTPPGKFMKLPKINLPYFSGDHLEWNAFWDLFNQIIHLNPDLSCGKSFILERPIKRGSI